MTPANESHNRALMHACVLHAVGDLRYQQVPKPHPKSGQVLVRVAFCGVCGSDIPRVFVKGTYRFPTIIGHEFSGIVEECGEGVDRVLPGERVVVFPLIWCGKCAPCEQGKYVQCTDYDYLGSRSDGAFAEYVIAPQENLLRVPEGVSLEEASMTEPAAVALHALRRIGQNLLGRSVAVFGAGPIGLMVAQWARAMGAAPIFVFDIVTRKVQMAQEMGFELAFNSREQDALEIIRSVTQREGVAISIECAGVAQTFVQAAACTMRGGTMVILGNPAADVTLPAALISQLMRREVAMLGTWNSDYSVAGNDDDWRAVLSGMERGIIALRPLITHQVPLRDAPQALLMMKEGREFFSKVLVYP
ncbi:MAG: galactitol-1-phosphate 5-dehydrogenase [Anaerolineae bacterium]